MLCQLFSRLLYHAARQIRSTELVSPKLTTFNLSRLISRRRTYITFTMSHLVFVYGTLKRGQPNHGFMTKPENGKATFIGEAKTVDKWPLVVATKFNIPFMLDKPGLGHHLEGEVYRIDDDMLKVLDKIERHPDNYLRQFIPVRFTQVNGDANSTDFTVGAVQECYTYKIVTYNEALLELPFEENFDDERHKYVPLEGRNLTADEMQAVWKGVHNTSCPDYENKHF